MNLEKHQNLRSIIMLKDVIRKWWRSELYFADKNGAVVDWQRGEILPPANDFCRLSLSSGEGFRCCTQSFRALHDRFKSSRKIRSAISCDCHLNFTVVGAPIYIQDVYQGFIFAEGFLQAPLTEAGALSLKGKILELNAGATDLERAIGRIPIMDATEFKKLTDLLELGVSEIARCEAEATQRDRATRARASEQADRNKFADIVGKSEPMQEVFRLLEKVCNSESTVLIDGESGTGKELVARAIHYNGPRRDGPFVVQNCSAFNDNLLESALFGHTRGAFTGALRDKKGLFEVADGGTFFLDEVGDMSAALQVKLLRVLQEGAFMPVGGTHPKEVDVRLIAATHKDLSELVKQGGFREDLFYRINVIRVRVPPLRERRDDVPILVEHFLKKHHRPGQRTQALAPEALEMLAHYSWPGNIRELENEIERLLVLGSDLDILPADMISARIRQASPAVAKLRATGKMNEMVERLERAMIQEGLTRTHHNKSQLARELGISRSNLILKIARYHLKSPEDAGDADGTARA